MVGEFHAWIWLLLLFF